MQENKEGRTLVVLLKGWGYKKREQSRPDREKRVLKNFHDFVMKKFPNGIPLTPENDMSILSIEGPESISIEIFDKIDTEYKRYKKKNEHIDNIVIVAWSAGTLIARRILCLAWGVTEDGIVDRDKICDWAPSIRRILMISSVTRGWSISTATPAKYRFFYPVLMFIGKCLAMAKGGTPFILKLKRGEPFVISTRLQNIALEEFIQDTSNKYSEDQLPLIVSILGSKDEFMSPSDCIELTSSQNFVFIEMPESNHLSILEVDGEKKEHTDRQEVFDMALTQTRDQMGNDQSTTRIIDPDDVNDYLDSLDRIQHTHEHTCAVKDIVIVLHGIRDDGFWAKRISREIKRLGDRTVIRSPTPGYGFFSMWDFIRPRRRREQTLWFMEQYADARDYYRGAAISFFGHSNGTYLAANAMRICPAIKFEKIAFAGSVVRTDFNWSELDDQIADNIINITAANDRVVSLLPGSMEKLGLRFLDVGGGGFHGFTDLLSGKPAAGVQRLKNLGPIEGNHSAALLERHWNRIAEFFVSDVVPNFDTAEIASPNRITRYGPALLILIAIIVLGFFLVSTVVLTIFFNGWTSALCTLGLILTIRHFVRYF